MSCYRSSFYENWSSKYNDWSSSLRNTRGDLTVDPPGSLSDLVVDPRLLVHRAPKPCARDPYQRPPWTSNISFVEGEMLKDVPPALVVDDERSPGVAQAGVVLAGLVPGAEHLRVELGNARVNRRCKLQSLDELHALRCCQPWYQLWGSWEVLELGAASGWFVDRGWIWLRLLCWRSMPVCGTFCPGKCVSVVAAISQCITVSRPCGHTVWHCASSCVTAMLHSSVTSRETFLRNLSQEKLKPDPIPRHLLGDHFIRTVGNARGFEIAILLH